MSFWGVIGRGSVCGRTTSPRDFGRVPEEARATTALTIGEQCQMVAPLPIFSRFSMLDDSWHKVAHLGVDAPRPN
jgi:hypothetical protein